MCRIRLFTYLFLFCSSLSVFPQTTRPNVINFEPRVYKGANKNWSIDADKNGIVYFANNKGLVTFDGVTWELHTLPSKGIVRSVGVANNREIYVGGTDEFGKWERDVFNNLKYYSLSSKIEPKKIQNSDFWRTIVTQKGVYFQSFSNIFFYDYKQVRKLESVDAPILLLNRVRDELLYQKMKSGIYFLRGEKSFFLSGSEIFANTDVRVILPYGKKGYLFATNSKGLIVYENGTYRNFNGELSVLLNTKEINTGIVSPRGTYLLGTLLDGIYEIDFNGKILGHYSSGNLLQNNSVLSMFQDHKNNVWLGLDKGISYISYENNLSYFTNTIDNIGAIYTACFWKDYLLIGTNQGVFSISKSDLNGYSSVANLHFIKGTEGQVWSLKVIDNKLYCCHNNGLYTIGEDGSVTKSYNLETGVFNISKERLDNNDYLIVSTYLSLKFIDLISNRIIHLKGVSEPIYDTKIDHLGNLWLEHPYRGVYRCHWNHNSDSLASVHYYKGPSPSFPTKFQLFKVGGRINMVGNDRIFHYNDIRDKIEPNTVLNDLFKKNNQVKKIFSSGSPNLYLALSESTIYLFFYDGYKAFIINSWGLRQNLNFVDNYETVIPLNDSINLLALDDGFILHHMPDKFMAGHPQRDSVSQPIITSFKSFNREKEVCPFLTDGRENIHIKNSYNTIEISFIVKNSFSENLTVQYMLEGVDLDWSPNNLINKVTYERIPSGDYTFRIRAVDINGNFSKEVNLSFTVRPPWYNSFWAYLVYLILIVAFSYLLRMIIFRRYEKQHQYKIRKLETMRLQILTDELQSQLSQKNAELVTQTSFIIQKNELIEKIRGLIEEFYSKNRSALLQQLIYKINSLLNNNLNNEEDWKRFLIKFEEKHTDFFKRLKDDYPSLTSADLRLCACLKLNMETKDIASLMNLSVRAVENNRYRLRKKFNLRTEQNLNEFFISMK